MAFHGLLIPQDLAPWRPHVTIQNKVAADARRARSSSSSERRSSRARWQSGPWRHGVIWAAPGSRSKLDPFRG